MTTIAHTAALRRPIAVAVPVVFFWVVAATFAAAAHLRLEPFSVAGGSVAAIAAVMLAAYAYTWFCARDKGTTHALGVGIAWLVMAIAAEMIMTTHLRHGWYGLLGTPARPLMRNLFLFVWVFAPLPFAHREAEG
jgi:hypothetical protein